MFGFNILGTGFKAIKSNFDRIIYEFNNSAPEQKKGFKQLKRSRNANRSAKGRSKLSKSNQGLKKSVANGMSSGPTGLLATRGVARGSRGASSQSKE